MVNLSEQRLNRTFAALSDPTRRALVERLRAESKLSVSALAEPFTISLPAVMKHLDLLAEAGLVARSKHGRVVTYTLTPAPLRGAMSWLSRHHDFWNDGLDRLEARVAAKQARQRKETSK
jgi:DNA-binding transcriptional ArsR family regulator